MYRTVCCLPIVACGLILAGCDPAVQARYQPTSTDEIFGAFSRVGGVDSETYELPATPPANVADAFRPRACRRPGLLMKPVDVVGLSALPSYRRTAEPTPLVAMSEPPPPSPRPDPAYRIASWNPHQELGVKEPIATPPYAPKLEPGRSVYRNEAPKLGVYQDFELVWCDEAARLR